MTAGNSNLIPDHEKHVLITERLELHLVKPDHLIQIWQNRFDNSELVYEGFTNPYLVLIEGPSPVRWRAPQVAETRELNRWFIRWIVLRETNEVIGSISFHAPPNSDGMIEVGLGIVEKFRRQGFARESLVAMWTWAAEQSEVKTLRYTVSPANRASVGLVESFGFNKVGQQIDEEDGPEDIYELPSNLFASTSYS